MLLTLFDAMMPPIALPLAPYSAEAVESAALEIVERLELETYYLFHAIRADLLRRLGRNAEAVTAYEAAMARTENAAERGFLERQRRSLTGSRS